MEPEPHRPAAAAKAAQTVARVKVGVAATLAAVVVVMPLLALLRAGIFGPLWSAAIWALGLVVAFAGWGTVLQRRLAPALDADLGLRTAWGLSLTVAAGGLLCLVGLARRPVLVAWVVMGLGLSAHELFMWIVAAADGERQRFRALFRWRWDTALVVGLLVLVGLSFVGAAARDVPNPNDDLLAYLPFAREIQQTGTLIQPFSLRRMAAYGGQSLLQAMTLLGADDAQVHLFDWGICRVVLVALVLGSSREAPRGSRLTVLVAALAAFMLPEVRINSTSEASGVVGFVAIFRTMVWAERNHASGRAAAFLLALPIAAVCTLRQNYMVVAALMLGTAALFGRDADAPERRRQLLRVAGLTAACLLPWAALAFRSNHTFLFPVFHGYYDPHYVGLTPASSWHKRLEVLLSSSASPEPVRLLPLLVLAAPAAARRWHQRPIAALWVGAIVGCAALVMFLPEADVSAIQRYTFAMLVAFMIGTALAASEHTVTAGGRADTAVLAVVLIALVVQVQGNAGTLERNLSRALERIAAHDRDPSPLLATQPAVRRVQEAVPAGERLLAMIERPYLFDFKRNRVVLLDQTGAVSPPPGIPLSSGEAMAGYLVGQGIRYFAFSYPDKAQYLYSRAHWTRLRTGGQPFWRATAPVYLAAFDAVDAIARTRHKLYDDGQMAVVDLTVLGQ